jgi:outer membrane receptor protein involved in Fe transport
MGGASLAILASIPVLAPVLAQAPEAAASESPAKTQSIAPTAPVAVSDAAAQEIVVTGSRLATGGFSTPTPVTVLNADRIAKLGITNVGDALAQLPSFRASTSRSSVSGGANIFAANAGATIADLRGLGASRTLVLVDGRRFVPSTTQGTVDLSLIPTLLVERSEIVTGGASAAYGSDAVSGVVNIIINKKLQGIRGSIQYGESEHGDGKDYLAQFAAGTSFGEGRGHVVFGAEYEKDKGTGGCYTRDFCGNEIADLTGVPGANGRPAHNITTNVRTATLTPGGLITATINAAGVRTAAKGGPLSGIQFAPDGSPVPFVYGANANTLFQEGGSGAGLNTFFGDPLLSIPVTRYNGYAHAEYEFSDAFTGFVEASYGHSAGYTRGAEIRDIGFPVGGDVIRIDNPYLPSSIKTIMAANGVTGLAIGKIGIDFGTTDSTVTRDTYRIVGGASGGIGGSWKYDAYVQYGSNDYSQKTINDRINANFNKAIDVVTGTNGAPICRINADAITTNDDPACVPLNILGQGQYTPAAKNYSFGTALQKSTLQQTVVAANVRGDLIRNWAGIIPVAAGVEFRNDSLATNVDPISAANGFYIFNATNTAGRVKVAEGYLESTIPLLKDSPFGRSLDLNGAVRRTYYRTSGLGTRNKFSATTWKIGAVYRPIDILLLRATKSRDIRAPNSSELFTSPVAGLAAIYDSKTGTTPFVQTLAGGNVKLRPEKADTFTVGATLQPRGALNGLRLSVDYFDVRIHGAISTLPAATIVQTCNDSGAAGICGLVTRDPSNGLLQSVSVLNLNLNRVRQNGLDFETSYRVPLSRFGIGGDGENALDLRVLATRTLHLTNSSVTYDRAGDNSPSGVPSWIVDGMASLSVGRASFTVQGHFLSAGKVDASLIGPEDSGYSITLPNSINTNRVPSRFYTTIGGSFDILKSNNRKLQIFGSVVNLFDVKIPPYFNGNANAIYYDNIGRRYRVGLRFTY